MGKPKRSSLEVAKTIAWYDLIFHVLSALKGLNAHKDIATYFHEELVIKEEDSNIFKKYKRGIVTPSNLWIQRCEDRFPGSYDYLKHKLWFFLEHRPLDEETLNLCLKNLPATFLHMICNDIINREIKDLTVEDIDKIKSYYNLNSLCCLVFLYYLGIKIGSNKLVNHSCLAIFDSFEKLSQFAPLKRAHIFLFNIISEQIFFLEFRENILNNPVRYFIPWQQYRERYWDDLTKQESINIEKKFQNDQILNTYLLEHENVMHELESNGLKDFTLKR